MWRSVYTLYYIIIQMDSVNVQLSIYAYKIKYKYGTTS